MQVTSMRTNRRRWSAGWICRGILQECTELRDASEHVAHLVGREPGLAEYLGVERIRRAGDQFAAGLGDLDERGASVLRVGESASEAGGLEAVDGIGRRRRMHLQ